jgi:hypothetical protein
MRYSYKTHISESVSKVNDEINFLLWWLKRWCWEKQRRREGHVSQNEPHRGRWENSIMSASLIESEDKYPELLPVRTVFGITTRSRKHSSLHSSDSLRKWSFVIVAEMSSNTHTNACKSCQPNSWLWNRGKGSAPLIVSQHRIMRCRWGHNWTKHTYNLDQQRVGNNELQVICQSEYHHHSRGGIHNWTQQQPNLHRLVLVKIRCRFCPFSVSDRRGRGTVVKENYRGQTNRIHGFISLISIITEFMVSP